MTQNTAENTPREAFARLFPKFYALVRDFPDFRVEPGLDAARLAALEQKLEIRLADEMRNFFQNCSAVAMNGLFIGARGLGPIVMPSSEALIIGEFYLHNPGDRLLMLPDDSSIYYLEQRNGAITRLARSLDEFFNEVLPRHL